MKVYILSRGEDYEGSSVKGVYRTYELARCAALEQPACFEGGWIEKDEYCWQNGCDYLKIQEEVVKGE